MTTGVDIIGNLVRQAGAITAVVPIGQIKAGALPDDVALPAILIRCVSSIEQKTLTRGATTRTIDRIAVTVRSASYREQRLIVGMVNTCCAGKTGDIGGGVRVSILSAGKGPDVRGPANTFEQTIDFRVSYDA